MKKISAFKFPHDSLEETSVNSENSQEKAHGLYFSF